MKGEDGFNVDYNDSPSHDGADGCDRTSSTSALTSSSRFSSSRTPEYATRGTRPRRSCSVCRTKHSQTVKGIAATYKKISISFKHSARKCYPQQIDSRSILATIVYKPGQTQATLRSGLREGSLLSTSGPSTKVHLWLAIVPLVEWRLAT